ncbi:MULTISPECIES: TIM barrel protein [Paraburkholderia]|uniref:TIM barrel protein n=1 Tax=Paraburkholderia TaxID=1822464 RepID=UPI0038BC9160
MQSEEGALAEHLEAVFQLVGHIQAGDVPGRREPGTGEIRFPFLLEQIKRLGWQGWIGCEYSPSTADTDACLDWAAPY